MTQTDRSDIAPSSSFAFEGTEAEERSEILFHPARERDNQDRLIPLINVVFLLLTFFLIAGTFKVADELKVQPVEIDSEGGLGKDLNVLYIDASGQITFEKNIIPQDQVFEVIKTWSAAHPGRELYVKADKAVTASLFLPVVKSISDAGVVSVRLMAIKKRG